MLSSMNLALGGIQAAQSGMRKAATEVAGAGLPGIANAEPGIVPLVELKQQARQVEVSVTVLKASDEMLGSLLDVKA